MADGASASQGKGKQQYYALKLGQEFIDDARQFERNWLYTTQDRGLWRLWWLIYCQTLGIDATSGEYNTNQQLRFVGEQQQYASFRVQLTRRIIQQRVMTAKDVRPSFVGVAINNDVVSLAQVGIASKAIDDLLTAGGLERASSAALEIFCNFGASGLLTSWDYDAGKPVQSMEPMVDPDGEPVMMPVTDPQSGAPMPEIGADGQPVLDPATGQPQPQLQPMMQAVMHPSGQPKYLPLYPWQFAVDPYMERDHDTIVVKVPWNKWELAELVPEYYDQIVACGIDTDMGDDALFAWGARGSVSSDTVVARYFFKANSKAVPGGRFAAWLGKDIPLFGVKEMLPCPVDEGLPVDIMVGPRYWGTAYGYPESSDLLSLQTVVNEAMSQLVTGLQRQGNANLWYNDMIQFDERALSQGGTANPMPAGATKPEWDDPPKISELSKFVIEWVADKMDVLLGSNSVMNGTPDANISSGAFATLMVNLAQKYASQTQESFDDTVTNAANKGLQLTRKNAANGFWAAIGGQADSPYIELIGQDKLKALDRVKLVRQSPVMSTFPGRMEVFNLVAPLPKRDRAAASEMLLSGRMDSFTESDQAKVLRIRKENELLLQGQPVKVGISDDPSFETPLHVMEYDKLRTQDPPTDEQALAQWQMALQCFENHILEHSMALATTAQPIGLACGWQPLGLSDATPGAGGKPKAGQPAQGGPKPGAAADEGDPSGPKQPQASKAPAGTTPQVSPQA